MTMNYSLLAAVGILIKEKGAEHPNPSNKAPVYAQTPKEINLSRQNRSTLAIHHVTRLDFYSISLFHFTWF
jgi:hypothetical protein